MNLVQPELDKVWVLLGNSLKKLLNVSVFVN
jgi:hypothetical protein